MLADLLAFLGLPGGTEWIIIGVVAVLIFGSRLPSVARAAGQSITEFKKGMKGLKDDLDEHPKKLDKDSSDQDDVDRKPN